MPWSTTTVSELRTAFVHPVRTAGRPVTRAAADFGISYRVSLILYVDSATSCCGRESDGSHPVRPAPDGQPAPGQVPGLPAPGREGPLARRVALGPDRRAPHPGPGGRARRAVRRDRPGHPPPL